MDRGLKERLVGAAVLVILAVIFIPMLLDDSPSGPGPITETNIPDKPDNGFNSRIVPVEPEPVEIELPEPPDVDAESSDTATGEPAAPAPAKPAEPVVETEADTGSGGGADGETEPAPPEEPALSQDMPEPDNDDEAKPSGWMIQLGSFSKEDNARDLNEELRASGYAAFVEPVTRDGKEVYRVRVGPQVLRSDAEKVRDKIAGEFDIEGIIISYP